MYCKDFRSISSEDVASCGGKGASLGEMSRAGIPVPPGFVVTAQAFDQFIKESKIENKIQQIIKSVKHVDSTSVNEASKKIRKLIVSAVMPKKMSSEIIKSFATLKAPLVAVRSSATAEDSSTASWAGELESYLNVRKNDVVRSVQECWSSLFTSRAIFYRFEKKLHRTKVSVAVVVQAMVQSEVSGIAFTVHPVTKDRKRMIIEAGWGLGEAIVGGRITPDSFVVNKQTFKIEEKSIHEQTMMIVRGGQGTVERPLSKAKAVVQKFSDKNVVALAKVCSRIERHYEKPQDIEWTFAKGKLSIVQSRPITTL